MAPASLPAQRRTRRTAASASKAGAGALAHEKYPGEPQPARHIKSGRRQALQGCTGFNCRAEPEECEIAWQVVVGHFIAGARRRLLNSGQPRRCPPSALPAESMESEHIWASAVDRKIGRNSRKIEKLRVNHDCPKLPSSERKPRSRAATASRVQGRKVGRHNILELSCFIAQRRGRRPQRVLRYGTSAAGSFCNPSWCP